MRFKMFWNRILDGLAKRRTKLFRKAIQSQRGEDWETLNKINKEMKRAVKKPKNKKKKELTGSTSDTQPPNCKGPSKSCQKPGIHTKGSTDGV